MPRRHPEPRHHRTARVEEARSPRGCRALLVAGAGLALALAALGPASCARPMRGGAGTVAGADLAQVSRWWILIGQAAGLEGVDWRHAARDAQMVVLAADATVRLDDLPRATLPLGYLSVGEVNPDTPHWGEASQRGYLVEANPDWPANMRVDIRDPRWQELLLTEQAPGLLARGFRGFMLDTIDTAPYLEGKDPTRFAGSRRALRDWARRLRQTFPRAVVIANGSDALVDVAPFIDGFVVEGVFATYDFGRRLYRATTPQERSWKLSQIEKAQAAAPHPVFTIEYADVGDIALGRWASDESERHGFRPYVTVKDLNAMP